MPMYGVSPMANTSHMKTPKTQTSDWMEKRKCRKASIDNHATGSEISFENNDEIKIRMLL